MRNLGLAVALVALATAAPLPAQGVPPAQWPSEVRAYHAARVQECSQFEQGRMVVSEDTGPYVRAADFNADGRPDYLVDGHALRCSSAATLFCGSLGCEYTLFVSQPNGRYADGGGFMGEAEYIVQNGRPLLRVDGNRGVRLWGWNGREFTIVGSGPPGQAAATRPVPSTVPTGSFTLNVTLDAEAARQLTAGNHQLRASVYYFGTPAPGYRGPTDEAGDIDLGMGETAATGRSGPIVLGTSGLRRDLIGQVRGGRVMAYITVQAARAAVLDCNSPNVPVSEVIGRTTQINCRAFVARRR